MFCVCTIGNNTCLNQKKFDITVVNCNTMWDTSMSLKNFPQCMCVKGTQVFRKWISIFCVDVSYENTSWHATHLINECIYMSTPFQSFIRYRNKQYKEY